MLGSPRPPDRRLALAREQKAHAAQRLGAWLGGALPPALPEDQSEANHLAHCHTPCLKQGGGFGLKAYAARSAGIGRLQHAQGQRDHAPLRAQIPVPGADHHLTGPPANRIHITAQLDLAACGTHTLGEIVRQLRVATLQMPRLIAADRVLGPLLYAKRFCTDHARVGSIEAFYIAGQHGALVLREGAIVQPFGKGHILAGEGGQFLQATERGVVLLLVLLQSCTGLRLLQHGAAALHGLQAGLFEELPQLWSPAVHELRAMLHQDALGGALRVDPAADTIARLQHQHAHAALRQSPCRGQAGNARANYKDINVLILHFERPQGLSTIQPQLSKRRRPKLCLNER